jgi:hypothetical protein
VRCFHHQPAQARVIGRVLLQHPVAHAAIDRLVHDLRTEAPRHATHEVLAEALVAQDLGDVGVAAGDEEAERRAMHRFDCAQAMEVGVGVGNDLGRKRIEERLPFGGPWQRLVQGAPRSRPEVSPRQHSTMPGLTSTRTEITLWSRLHAKEKRT